MSEGGLTLNKLHPEDIDEKIYLNAKDGVDIHNLEKMIKEELKDFQWVKIRAEVQCQCYIEQLQHISKRIEQIKEKGNPYEGLDYKKKLEDFPNQ